ncbi:MAG: PilZ domain-containing protein [Gammaproteobacteria bacterium]
MLRERRQNERKTLATPVREVVIFIESNGERCPFHKVKDVSVSGAGIQLPIPLAPNSHIVLGFDQEDYQVRVQGTVVWCRPLEEESANVTDRRSYRMGVRFNPLDMKNSSMLFLALREFIDPFGAD